MTDRELKKLNKSDLLSLLLDQSREIDRLSARVKELEEQLDSKMLLMQEAGSLAEQAMRLNRVFEAAQAAADQYLENIRHYANEAGTKAAEENTAEDSDTEEDETDINRTPESVGSANEIAPSSENPKEGAALE